jgi:hypothetical protein
MTPAWPDEPPVKTMAPAAPPVPSAFAPESVPQPTARATVPKGIHRLGSNEYRIMNE